MTITFDELKILLKTIDSLGLALSDCGHVWTKDQRIIYNSSVLILLKNMQTALDDERRILPSLVKENYLTQEDLQKFLETREKDTFYIAQIKGI